MTDPKAEPFDTSALRAEAERWLRDRGRDVPAGSRDPMVLLSELMIHEAELELQNQQLRETQEALELAKTRYFTLFDLAPVGYFVLGTQHHVEELNLAGAELLGSERARVKGRPLALFIHPDERDRLGEHLAAAFASDRRHSVELRLRTPPDQPTRHALLQSQQLRVEVGAPPLCLVTCTDVTEQRRAEEQRRELELKQRDKQRLESLGVLAGGVAHDFNNLLTVILGHVSLVRARLHHGEPAGEDLHRIETAVHSAADLCRQMLAYSGRGRFVVEPVDLSAVVRETAQLVELSGPQRSALRLELAPDLPRVMADRTQLRQIVMNLVINAAEAIAGGEGRIDVTTGVMQADRAYLDAAYLAPDLAEGTYVFLEVADDGCGMSSETRARIFDPFFTTKFTGRGLGLAAVLGGVRSHGGALRVDSCPGEGAVFRLLLPPAGKFGAAQPQPPARPAPAAVAGTRRVLVVEDTGRVRRITTQVLQQLGWDALTAASGPEAVALYRQHADEIAVVLLDMMMPGMDGEAVFQELVRARPDVKIVVTSGYSEGEFARRFAGCSPAAFLPKPYRVDELAQVLATVVPAQT